MKGDLGPSARELLEQGGDVGEPDAAALARGRQRLLQRVGGVAAGVGAVKAAASTVNGTVAATAAAPVAAVSAAAVPAALPFVAMPMFVKVGVIALVAVGVTAGGVALRAPAKSVVRPVNVAAITPAPKNVAPLSAPLGVAAEPAPVARESAASAKPAGAAPAVPVAPALASASTLRHATASSTASSTAPSPELAADVARLGQAQAALVAGNPQEARELALAMQPSGPLADEREGIRVLAGCALHEGDARSRALRFVEQAPSRPLAERVREACLPQGAQ